MTRRHVLGAEAAVDPVIAAEVAAIMHALATRSRVQLLGRLADGPATVGELVGAVGMEQSAVSHQLQVLRHLGLIVGTRQGRHVIYALHDAHLADVLREAVAHIEHRALNRPTALAKDSLAA